jgi:hypothetical protein
MDLEAGPLPKLKILKIQSNFSNIVKNARNRIAIYGLWNWISCMVNGSSDWTNLSIDLPDADSIGPATFEAKAAIR